MCVVRKNSNESNAGIDKVSRRVRANGDGTIFKDKKRNLWIALFYDIQNVRRRGSFRKKADADAWIVEQKNVMAPTECAKN